jgi:hypothetical protein
MRIAMMYKWEGIAGGSCGLIKGVKSNPTGGSLLTVKFDYGETREVPLAATISEIVFKNKQLTPHT